LYIALAAMLALVVLAVTGWWRLAFLPFRINPAQMTVSRRGLAVTEPADVERVEAILQSFAHGFNKMIARPSGTAWRRYCNVLPALYEPFAQEGAAMGHTLRRLFRYRPEAFETEIVGAHPEFRYLHYVGLGFWSGMRNHTPARVMQITERLDPLLGQLVYDGYGFKHGFFDYQRDASCFDRFDGLTGYARNVAYQGAGRSFWFLYMNDHDALIEHLGRLGTFATDGAGGSGLAAAFVNPDRFDVAQAFAVKLPEAWQPHFQLGLCFGLKARSAGEPAWFAANLEAGDAETAEAIRAAIDACDRIEHETRAAGGDDPYRRWRESVTQWMASHLEYPLAAVRTTSPVSRLHEPAHA
jgi:hypothetical protein